MITLAIKSKERMPHEKIHHPIFYDLFFIHWSRLFRIAWDRHPRQRGGLRVTGKKCRKIVSVGNGTYELPTGKGETTPIWKRVAEGDSHKL